MRLLLTLLWATLIQAQDPQFDVDSRLVMVPVTVTDSKGRPVDGLEPSDFRIYDNGVLQQVAVDTTGTGVAPIALVVAVQSSGISVPVLEKVQKIGVMIQPLITGERGCAALLTFDQEVQWRQECTSDADLLQGAFFKLQPGDYKTARMLDAVVESVKKLRTRPNVRRVLLLISESRDRGSETELQTAAMSAQAAGVTVYSFPYSAYTTAFTTKSSKSKDPEKNDLPRPNRTEPLSPKGRVPMPPPEQRVDILGGLGELMRLGKVKDIEVLASSTGGTSFSFTRQKALEAAIEKLGGELHSQYVLSFAPSDPTPGYHRIEVKIEGSSKHNVRARPGYWSR
ncbi:MAG TPA: VWA domain-containing protein [Bryobacteraceae bacterium]|nr:VWA domain-containing protein [Bryobacteraceae bacterium]